MSKVHLFKFNSEQIFHCFKLCCNCGRTFQVIAPTATCIPAKSLICRQSKLIWVLGKILSCGEG